MMNLETSGFEMTWKKAEENLGREAHDFSLFGTISYAKPSTQLSKTT